MNTKQKTMTAAGGGLAACVAAALLSVTLNGSGQAEFEMDYSFKRRGEYSQTLILESPENFTADVTELYLNGELVTDCVLPYGELTSIPLVFTDMEHCRLQFYKMGEEVGYGEFDVDGTLTVTVDEDVIIDETEAADEAVNEEAEPEVTVDWTVE